MRLGAKIKELRRDRFTQKELARAAGLSQTTISDLERGRNAGSSEIVAIARALGVSVEELTNSSPAKRPDEPIEHSEELLAAWRLLSPKQRTDELARLQALAATNVDLVRQLGHLRRSPPIESKIRLPGKK